MTGELSYFEIGSPNAAQVQTFFGALLGWDFPPAGPGQVSIETPTLIGGIHGDNPAPAITAYFTVQNIDVSVSLVRELGGSAESPGPEVPGFGRFSDCSDDQSIPFGLRQLPV